MKHKINKFLENFLTVPEVCQRLNISQRTLERMMQYKKIKFIYIPKHAYFDPKEVEIVRKQK